MMITIYGLPVSAKYQEVKVLIRQVCNVNEFILDNIVADIDGQKKVKVGVMNDADGEIVLNCLNGYRMGGNNLRVVPMGKPEYQQPPENFDNRGVQPQNNFNNNFSQPRGDLWGQGPAQWQGNSAAEPQNFNYRSQAPNNQYGAHQMPPRDGGAFGQQLYPSHTPQQGPSYPPTNKDRVVDSRSHNLRNVELIDEPMNRPLVQDRMPNNNQGFNQKPHTIMKDNFQGPQYIHGQPAQAQVSFQNQPAVTPWAQPSPQPGLFPKPNQPSLAPHNEYAGVPKFSPSGRPVSPRRVSPRRFSPGRKGSPGRFLPGRKGSPGRFLPGRKGSPGRRMSPDRRYSPSGRRYSPIRRGSPGNRRSPGRSLSPDRRRRMSPERRSPGRRVSPRRDALRFSPPRNIKTDDGRPLFGVSKAPSQDIYSGGYRAGAQENVQFPPRREEPVWQNARNVNPDDDKKDNARDPKFGLNFEAPSRRSRSPNRRDRSPLKDRYKKHSPSPRSPRRSWALEKRNSPKPSRLEPPPPPLWPGQSKGFTRDHPKADTKGPVWEGPINIKDEKIGDRQFEDRKSFRDVPRESSPRRLRRSPDRFERDPLPRRYSPDRSDFRDMPSKSGHPPRNEQTGRKDDYHGTKKPFMYKTEELNKDFEDIYKRAQEFKKKTEELKEKRHSEDRFGMDDRRRDERDVDRRDYRRFDVEPANVRERPTFEDARPRDGNPRKEDSGRHREPDWLPRYNVALDKAAKEKRDKAVEDISQKILSKRLEENLKGDVKTRIMQEMKICIMRILNDMFGSNEVSYIEMIIKFDAKFDMAKQDKIFDEVMSNFPKHFRKLKRPASDIPETVTKSARIEHQSGMNQDLMPTIASNAVAIADWQANINHAIQNQALQLQLGDMAQVQMMMQSQVMFQQSQALMQPVQGMMLPSQALMQPSQAMMQTNMSMMEQDSTMTQNYNPPQNPDNGHSLYLCKDDFDPFVSSEDNHLKQFLVSEILKATQFNRGWTPDFTFKGLQSLCRYELFTTDDASKDWLLNVDFSLFEHFNVLVYTKEELWYERAAIWLPGHSRCRNIEPLQKLKLQNQTLQNINLGKWKLIKKIVTTKGTRVYVDMPPSSARALEQNNMLLSYELQTVSVYSKAVAVDKDAFDAGLKDQSIIDPSEIAKAIQSSPLPTLHNDEPNVIKITLKGNKSVNVQDARKIKEMIIHHIFKTHRARSDRKTDFLKFGMIGTVFGIVPANEESKRWLIRLNIGKINKQEVVILDKEGTIHQKLFKMFLRLPQDSNSMNLTTRLAIERLKNGNKGVKGLNFHLWQMKSMKYEWRQPILEVCMDIESIDTIMKMKFKLDYIDNTNSTFTCVVKQGVSLSKLKDEIAKHKAELMDKYEVANMEIESSGSEEDDDVVYVGHNKILTFNID